MRRGIPAGVTLALSALLAGCGAGGSEDEGVDLDVPAGPEEASSVVVRVSGTEGVPYLGFYGTVAEEEELEGVEDVVGAEPTDYEVEVPEGMPSANVFVEFEKTEPGQGELKAQILGDDKVVEEAKTLSRLGRVRAEWYSANMFVGAPPA